MTLHLKESCVPGTWLDSLSVCGHWKLQEVLKDDQRPLTDGKAWARALDVHALCHLNQGNWYQHRVTDVTLSSRWTIGTWNNCVLARQLTWCKLMRRKRRALIDNLITLINHPHLTALSDSWSFLFYCTNSYFTDFMRQTLHCSVECKFFVFRFCLTASGLVCRNISGDRIYC